MLVSGMIRKIWIFALFCTRVFASSPSGLFVDAWKMELMNLPLPLSVYDIPLQEAQVNTPFHLNLRSYIRTAGSDFYYRIMNQSSVVLGFINILGSNAGLTSIHSGNEDCTNAGNTIFLPGQSCTLGFHIDKTTYHSGSALLVCSYFPFVICAQPESGSRLDDMAELLKRQIWLDVTPSVLNGLYYDAATMSINGKSNFLGNYQWIIHVSDGYVNAEPRTFSIHVASDPRDKPVFKEQIAIPNAIVGKKYQFNLMSLIEPVSGFMETNQVRFKIVPNSETPQWLTLDQDKSIILQGDVPDFEAGQTKKTTLIASSNTGGDSLPLTIMIPVTWDPSKKPVIKEGIILKAKSGYFFEQNLNDNLIDPLLDSNIKLVLDKIEPAAPWLKVAEENPTSLRGNVPSDLEGQRYQVTLHANTSIGGDSESLTIPLSILVDKSKTPRFSGLSPHLPLLYTGQAYSYDFSTAHLIEPEDIPYLVTLANGYDNPSWVRIENNQLLIDQVPKNVGENQKIWMTVSNTPGGRSDVFMLDLVIMKSLEVEDPS